MKAIRMPNINQVALTGRLCADPEVRATDRGNQRMSLRLAVNKPYMDQAGEWQEDTSFFNVTVWDKQVEFLAPKVSKGTPIFLTGQLRSYEMTDEAGTKTTRIEVVARHVQVLEREVDETANR
jgi:single-strand DNA-binding protein